MELYHTLAYSDIGTHKMKFKEEMEFKKAVSLGKEYCNVKGMVYIGTLTSGGINIAERALRKKLYNEPEGFY